MSISTLLDPRILNIFSLDDLIAYMSYQTGWEKVRSKRGWHVFVSQPSISPVSLEIVLPEKYDPHTAPTYIASALGLLADIKEEDPELLAKSIDRYESDILYVRNTAVSGNDSIELNMAVKQLQDLRNLVQYGTDMELRRMPFDVLTHTTEANRQSNIYRFGHTFRGSFGFTLEAPLMTDVEKTLQAPLSRDITDDVPMSRKVMERIATGLKLVHESAQGRTSDLIVSNFEIGLNANMCGSLRSVSDTYANPVEYRILWSPILQARSDVSDFRPVLVDEDELVYLQVAERRLKELRESVPVEVRGLVKDVGTTDDPLGNVATRTIILKWLNNPFSNRLTDITMNVDAEAYRLAHSANIDWNWVFLVEGDARYIRGRGWHLNNPRNFRLEVFDGE